MTGLAALALLATLATLDALCLLGGLTCRALRGGVPPTRVALLKPYQCSARFSEFSNVVSPRYGRFQAFSSSRS